MDDGAGSWQVIITGPTAHSLTSSYLFYISYGRPGAGGGGASHVIFPRPVSACTPALYQCWTSVVDAGPALVQCREVFQSSHKGNASAQPLESTGRRRRVRWRISPSTPSTRCLFPTLRRRAKRHLSVHSGFSGTVTGEMTSWYSNR